MNDYRERFYSKFKINPETDCWEWTANRFPKGYGNFKLHGKSNLAHRISYELHFRKIPSGLVICHKCDNPPCVNPEHLFMGTQKDNLLDRHTKGRSITGEKNGRCKLKSRDILIIRKFLSDKVDQRDIAREYGVAQTTISSIKLNKSWRHI